jgi:hypothetical protein
MPSRTVNKQLSELYKAYLVFGGNKPLPCFYQHEPQQGLTPNDLTGISPIAGANLLLLIRGNSSKTQKIYFTSRVSISANSKSSIG